MIREGVAFLLLATGLIQVVQYADLVRLGLHCLGPFVRRLVGASCFRHLRAL